ncbi:MAG: PilN domain-containing protein [Deltaproteobacteria bacterium]|nr:PilN domain-containing protein [Deltaproteobacteria bacterium]
MKKTKINLLGNSQKSADLNPLLKRPVRTYKPSLFVFIFAFILIGFEVAFLISFYQNIDHKNAELELKRFSLKDQISVVEKDLQAQSSILPPPKPTLDPKIMDALKMEQPLLITLLSTIRDHLPQNAWIYHLAHHEDNITITGYTFTHESVSQFLSELRSSQLFETVKLILTEQTLLEEQNVKQFTIQCGLKGV